MADLKTLTDQLGAVPLFAALSRKDLTAVARAAKIVDHEPGHVVTEQGKSAAGFHLILDGKATVLVGGEERGVLGSGDYFGEISLIDGLPRMATVRAETPLRTAGIASWDFKPLLREHPSIAEGLLEGLCARLRAQSSLA